MLINSFSGNVSDGRGETQKSSPFEKSIMASQPTSRFGCQGDTCFPFFFLRFFLLSFVPLLTSFLAFSRLYSHGPIISFLILPFSLFLYFSLLLSSPLFFIILSSLFLLSSSLCYIIFFSFLKFFSLLLFPLSLFLLFFSLLSFFSRFSYHPLSSFLIRISSLFILSPPLFSNSFLS